MSVRFGVSESWVSVRVGVSVRARLRARVLDPDWARAYERESGIDFFLVSLLFPSVGTFFLLSIGGGHLVFGLLRSLGLDERI